MHKKVKDIFFITTFFAFAFLLTKHYFSEQNVIFINKSRSYHLVNLNEDSYNLPILQNDTNNIIVYKDDLEIFKKKRKKRFWEKLISNSNE